MALKYGVWMVLGRFVTGLLPPETSTRPIFDRNHFSPRVNKFNPHLDTSTV